jgi:acyl-CoA synthetase (AMP-forming)/AMP-acid ligase II
MRIIDKDFVTNSYPVDSLDRKTSLYSNLVELLSCRALFQPAKTAFIFLEDGETESSRLTYQELDLQARRIAAHLQSLQMEGERALLLYQSGPEFVAAFFGCLYAGVIAVPLYPPRRTKHLARLQDIVADAGAKLALTSASTLKNISNYLADTPDLAALHWLDLEQELKLSANDWQKPSLYPDYLAFLQYTSGSTDKPKGVMVSHHNLLRNFRAIELAYSSTSDSVVVSWLPLFHDMGLICGMLMPIYLGCRGIMMPPTAFLQKPVRWLQAISNYRGTHTTAPNFAYELCVRKINEEQKSQLNLASLMVAGVGAEPVRKETLEQFAQDFASSGFNPQAFCPSYGLAEATLAVSGVRLANKVNYYSLDSKALADNQTREVEAEHPQATIMVGCGSAEIDTKVVIVNPDTLCECAPQEVGEIWVRGSTVAKGYWQNPEKTKETFQAYLANTNKGPFLRTGDLGCIQGGELIVTGRLKDVIIIRGKNHYPQDIELTVEQSHSAIVMNHCAAFSLEIEGEEKLIVVSEVERSLRFSEQSITAQDKKVTINNNRDGDNKLILAEIIRNIRQSVSREHGLQVHGIALLRFGSIPKTSSGKIQRYACRHYFVQGKLNVLYHDCGSMT